MQSEIAIKQTIGCLYSKYVIKTCEKLFLNDMYVKHCDQAHKKNQKYYTFF